VPVAGDRGLELLRIAGDLVAQGWAQHADARTASGDPTEAWAEDAVTWSLLGALVAGLERLDGKGDGRRLIEDLGRVCVALADVIACDSLELWNDDPARTREEILHSLDAASRLLPVALFVVDDN
jgi:hypothetical protein